VYEICQQADSVHVT